MNHLDRETTSDIAHASLGQLLDDLPDATLVVDSDGMVRYANAAVASVLGYAPDELVGSSFERLVPPAQRDVHAIHVKEFHAAPMTRPLGARDALRAHRRDGTDIPVEIALVPMRTHDGHVAVFIRDITTRHRLVRRLTASNRLVTTMLGDPDRDETLQLGAALAADLLHSDTCVIALLDPDSQHQDVVAVHGEHDARLRGQSVPVQPFPGWWADPTGVLQVDDVEMMITPPFPELDGSLVGPVLVVRIGSCEEVLGSLTFTRGQGSPSFDATDRDVAVQFASSLTVALLMDAVRGELADLERMTDRDRIARDLHDTVIQRIFAIGMRLESAVELASGPAADRIAEAVDSLDTVIRDIRTAIFGLHHPEDQARGIRALLMKEVAGAGEALGFTPRVGFIGPVELLVDVPLSRTLVNVLREALSNVVRHAAASEVEVVLQVEEDVCLTVLDDGVGVREEPTAGTGLANMAQRAQSSGGSFTVDGREPRGTIVQWRAPLPPS